MKLNKCEYVNISKQTVVFLFYKDDINIHSVPSAPSPDFNIGIKTSSREELSKRFANTVATIKKLDLFWRDSNCDTSVKIYIADAILI